MPQKSMKSMPVVYDLSFFSLPPSHSSFFLLFLRVKLGGFQSFTRELLVKNNLIHSTYQGPTLFPLIFQQDPREAKV